MNWEDYLARTYLFWTPHPWLALRAEYQYEHIKRDSEQTNGVRKMDTHRVPFGFNFFHPCGLSASATATYIHQDGRFDYVVFPYTTDQKGSDDFFTVDAAITYRIPKRHGFLTVGVNNLTDENFKYFNTDFNNPGALQPDRVFYATFTVAIP